MIRNAINTVNQSNKKQLGIVLTVLFALVLGCGMSTHVMWRDEYEQYLFRLHNGFVDTGSPFYIIYNILCWVTVKISASLFSFKILHFGIMVATVAVMVFASPLGNIEKALLCFNYYFVYEYGVICRYYGLIALLLLSATALTCSAKRKYCVIAILVLLLAELNPLSGTYAFAILCYLTLDFISKLKEGLRKNEKSDLLAAALVLVIGGGCLVFKITFFLSNPFHINPFQCAIPPWITAVNQIWNAYFPIPDFHPAVRFWGTNIFPFSPIYPPNYTFGFNDLSLSFIIPFFLSIAVLLITLSKLLSTPKTLATYLSTTILQLVILHNFIKIYQIRYIGILFLTFVVCYWLHLYEASSQKKSASWSFNKNLQSGFGIKLLKSLQILFKPLLYILLISQVYASCYALYKDSKHKFSHSEDLGKFIKWADPKNTHVIVGYPDYAVQCLAALLDKKIFFPQIDDFSYYCDSYNIRRKSSVAFKEIIDRCVYFTEELNLPVYLILSFPIILAQDQILENEMMIDKNTSIKLLSSFPDEVICGDEVYWVYELKKHQ